MVSFQTQRNFESQLLCGFYRLAQRQRSQCLLKASLAFKSACVLFPSLRTGIHHSGDHQVLGPGRHSAGLLRLVSAAAASSLSRSPLSATGRALDPSPRRCEGGQGDGTAAGVASPTLPSGEAARCCLDALARNPPSGEPRPTLLQVWVEPPLEGSGVAPLTQLPFLVPSVVTPLLM